MFQQECVLEEVCRTLGTAVLGLEDPGHGHVVVLQVREQQVVDLEPLSTEVAAVEEVVGGVVEVVLPAAVLLLQQEGRGVQPWTGARGRLRLGDA